MVDRAHPQLDRVFSALSDATRRGLIARLHGAPDATVSELARPLPISLPAVMKHLDVLEGAGLIARAKRGRTVHVRLTPAPLEDAAAWLERHRRFWGESLDRLAEIVEDKA
ncbi:MAG: metalloregulator ArsR/SmtB family transcription factor [Acetobacteraceae bacterium]|nr:metalloregulator ArsR/SmtB family transcription factor [Acetobacteraceae bacterium]